jgi:hypothetical protein
MSSVSPRRRLAAADVQILGRVLDTVGVFSANTYSNRERRWPCSVFQGTSENKDGQAVKGL